MDNAVAFERDSPPPETGINGVSPDVTIINNIHESEPMVAARIASVKWKCRGKFPNQLLVRKSFLRAPLPRVRPMG